MKSKIVLWLTTIIAAYALPGHAQVLQTIYSFTNPDGAAPYGALTLGTDGNFYGVTRLGGSNYCGTVFKATPNGAVTTVFSFNHTNGAVPAGALTLGTDGNLYGTTGEGGLANVQNTNGMGTVFRFDTNSTLTTLLYFNQDNGTLPRAPLTLGPDGTLYGTTAFGGFTNTSLPLGHGTVFSINVSGDLTTLAQFRSTNGYEPASTVTMGNDGKLYGTTFGGTNGTIPGTLFVVGTNGGLQMLKVFGGTNGSAPNSLTVGNDGNLYGIASTNFCRIDTNGSITVISGLNSSNRITSLTLASDGNFFGTASNGIFLISTNGLITKPITFDGTIGRSINPVTLSTNGFLYGSALSGGTENAGTVFRTSTNGDWQVLFSFHAVNGANPRAGLTMGPDGNFYGTTIGGGFDYGTVFKITRDGNESRLVSFDGFKQGAHPTTALTLASDGKFYGTTPEHGLDAYPCYNSQGTIYSITTNGILTTLFSFNDATNGAIPESSLTLGSDGYLYGTTRYAGITCAGYPGQLTGYGTIFKISTNGNFSQLNSFQGYNFQYPQAPLTEGPDGSFYGTAGSVGYGTLFKMRTNSVLTSVASFNFTNGTASARKLVFARDGYMYGTTTTGGISNAVYRFGLGVVFRAATNGNISKVFQFDKTNSGIYPTGALYPASDGWLYGVTAEGGVTNPTNTTGFGTIYRVNPSGLFKTLAYFDGTNGAYPQGDLIPGGDGYLYGVTYAGGADGYGAVFRLLLQPEIISSPQGQTNLIGTDVILYCIATNTVGAAYQWQMNGTNISGATNTTYAIQSATVHDSGNYSVIITNPAGSVTSSNISIRIVPPGTLTLDFLAGRPSLNLFGSLNSNYTVQYTTNLSSGDWIDLLTVTNLSGNPNQIIDLNSTIMPGRFYRAVNP
jgi:uncharacterized repeat protein (TIGR03803 family)